MMKLYVSSDNEPKEPNLKISFTYSLPIVNDNVFDVILSLLVLCFVLPVDKNVIYVRVRISCKLIN